MIYKPNTRTETTGIYGFRNGILRDIVAVYNGLRRLIWQKVRSCYGTGIWLQERPWIDTDLWRDNK